MPFRKFALLIAYVIVAAALTVFLVAQALPQTPGAVMIALPLAMLAAVLIRKMGKDAD